MPIINTKYLPEAKTIRLIDLTEDSINRIAEAVVNKLNKSVRHGHWVDVNPMVDTLECSECGYQIISEDFITPYCPECGVKMINEYNDN